MGAPSERTEVKGGTGRQFDPQVMAASGVQLEYRVLENRGTAVPPPIELAIYTVGVDGQVLRYGELATRGTLVGEAGTIEPDPNKPGQHVLTFRPADDPTSETTATVWGDSVPPENDDEVDFDPTAGHGI